MLYKLLTKALLANLATVLLLYFLVPDWYQFLTTLFFSTWLQIYICAFEDLRQALVKKAYAIFRFKLVLHSIFAIIYSLTCLGFIFILNQDRIPNGPGMLDATWKLFTENAFLVLIATLPILIGVITDTIQKKQKMYFASIHVKIFFAAILLAAVQLHGGFIALFVIKFIESGFEGLISESEQNGGTEI